MLNIRAQSHRAILLPLALVSLGFSWASSDYRPSASELKASYQRADTISRDYSTHVFNVRLAPVWLEGGKRFYYRSDPSAKHRTFYVVDAATGQKSPAFDHKALAEGLAKETGETIDADFLPFTNIRLTADAANFNYKGQGYKFGLSDHSLAKAELVPVERPQREAPWVQDTWPPETGSHTAPDKSWSVELKENNVFVKSASGEEKQLTKDGVADHYYSRTYWTPDSKRLIAVRVTPGDRKKVSLYQSSNTGTTRGKLESRLYDQPGDKVDTFDMQLLDVAKGTETAVNAEPVDYGDLPRPRWMKDEKHFTYDKMDRGYGRWRIISVDSETGATNAVVDDDPPTFVDSTAQFSHFCEDSDNVIWRSERDGWGHLYLSDGGGKILNQITKGNWVVRGVEHVDDNAKQLIFSASGMNPKEDPYFIHYYRINYDGSNMVPLTPAVGNHSAQFSPDQKTLVDTYSTIDTAPVHELRRVSDGKELAKLEECNTSDLKKINWQKPEAFVAKGRDGKTDIYGVVYRPTNFDPKLKYPIVENIYAGPQDSFVPKSFFGGNYMQGMAELGFIVVQIDGMGTRNRGKAFHDVCFKNLADAGFPDRILWMKALAAKYPYMDADRVGIFGTSAGGQNSAGAVLFHPEFYKVAVSSCGCHDNRIDKLWWNEQWMSYPVGPHYEAQSNITNAAKLRGNLLLMVGEMDHNVPPESTFRFADALEKANKDFELVVITGSDHTAGGPYGERKRRDFFVRHLLGVDPPVWNGG